MVVRIQIIGSFYYFSNIKHEGINHVPDYKVTSLFDMTSNTISSSWCYSPYAMLISYSLLCIASIPMPKDCQDIRELGGGRDGIYTIFPTETEWCFGVKVWSSLYCFQLPYICQRIAKISKTLVAERLGFTPSSQAPVAHVPVLKFGAIKIMMVVAGR